MQIRTLLHSVTGANTYRYGDAINIEDYNQCVLHLLYTQGLSISLEVVVEFSHDKSLWFRKVKQEVGATYATLEDLVIHTTEDGNKAYEFPVKDEWMRVGMKVTGTVTGSAVGCTAVLDVV